MRDNKILIIDYRVGNYQSVLNALKFLGCDCSISDKKSDILRARAYILPGVGAFGEAMKNLDELELIGLLGEQVVTEKKPILGICLGMQILANSSQEDGSRKGLGWIDGTVEALRKAKGIRIPHVGWNSLEILKKYPLFTKVEENANFYFDHSYRFVCDDKYVSAKCSHGYGFTAAVQKDNIFGVQFHPEKSQNNGLKLFRSFLNYVESQR